jgi:ABC-type lipoprotein release transport system permease subunit
MLTVLGISVGIATIVFLISLGFGLQELSVKKISSISSLTALDVTPAQGSVVLNDASLKDFEKIPNVEKVSPLYSFAGQAAIQSKQADIVAYGVNADYFSLQGLKTKTGGIFNDSDTPIVVSTALAKALDVGEDALMSKDLDIKGYFPTENSSEVTSKESKYQVVGIIDDGSSSFVYLPLKTIKNLLNNDSVYNSAKVKANSTDNLPGVRTVIESKGYKAVSIADTIGQIYQFFKIIQIVLASFGAIALIVASIGMFNTMTIALLERTRDIGIMKALGVQNGSVRKMFLAESFLISFIGGIVGILMGLFTAKLVNFIINVLAKSVGGEPEKLFSTPILAVLIIIGFSILVGVTTGFYPSKRAGKLNPLDALRYE